MTKVGLAYLQGPSSSENLCESGFCLEGKSLAGRPSFIHCQDLYPLSSSGWVLEVLPDSYLRHHPQSLEPVLSGSRHENFILTISVLFLQILSDPTAGTVPLHFSLPKHSRSSVSVRWMNEGMWLPVPNLHPGSLPSSPAKEDTVNWLVQGSLWYSLNRGYKTWNKISKVSLYLDSECDLVSLIRCSDLRQIQPGSCTRKETRPWGMYFFVWIRVEFPWVQRQQLWQQPAGSTASRFGLRQQRCSVMLGAIPGSSI